MKFLILALCVCAASSASVGAYKPWQAIQRQAVPVGQAVAQAVVSVPEAAYKTFEQPAVKNFPVAEAKSAVYSAPGAVAKSAAYANKEANAAIIRSDSEVAPDSFQYSYETENGIAAQSSGNLKKVDDSEVLTFQGSYKYPSADGTFVEVQYIADENGYQPKSDLLPVGPAIPEAIIRSLEYIRTHPQKVENY